MDSSRRFIFTTSLIFVLFGKYKGDFVIQDDKYCGNYEQPKEERILNEDVLSVSSHSGQRYYSPNKDCIVTIIGKTYHQWEITLTNIDIDGDKDDCKDEDAPCCNDYLKIFNSYRVDNARRFPSIPWRGFCGEDLPSQNSFVSTQNYITIQFNANPVSESKTGFYLEMRQYPRRNSGVQQEYFGGWNDGSLTQLQVDWSEQEQIPADYQPAEDPTFDYDPNGIGCYECVNCKRDYFESSDIGVTTREGCYVCTKEWLQGIAQATRTCLSRSLYDEKLLTLQDPSGGLSVQDYRGCKTFIRGGTGTVYVNMCVCDTHWCNSGSRQKLNIVVALFLAACAYFSSELRLETICV